jgi:hypothetical protein
MRGGHALALVALAASGCASGAVGGPQVSAHATSGRVVEWYAGAPTGLEPQTAPDGHLVPLAARIDDRSRLRITIWGSSTCPSVIDSALLDEDGSKITLVLRGDSDVPCTADIAPATSVIQFPARLRIVRPVRVVAKRPGVAESWTVDV